MVDSTVQHFKLTIFGDRRPVYDGKRSLYTANPLPVATTGVDLDVTLPGEGGKDRPFKVSVKFVSLVSWHLLHEVLTRGTLPEPLELDKPISTNPVHVVDMVLRHLPSMNTRLSGVPFSQLQKDMTALWEGAGKYGLDSISLFGLPCGK